MGTLEQIIQVISIIVFISTAITFFVKVGEYKSVINTKIEELEKDIKELKDTNAGLKKEIEKLKNDTNNTINRIETLLIRVETKMELFMQMQGYGENGKSKK